MNGGEPPQWVMQEGAQGRGCHPGSTTHPRGRQARRQLGTERAWAALPYAPSQRHPAPCSSPSLSSHSGGSPRHHPCLPLHPPLKRCLPAEQCSKLLPSLLLLVFMAGGARRDRPRAHPARGPGRRWALRCCHASQCTVADHTEGAP